MTSVLARKTHYKSYVQVFGLLRAVNTTLTYCLKRCGKPVGKHSSHILHQILLGSLAAECSTITPSAPTCYMFRWV